MDTDTLNAGWTKRLPDNIPMAGAEPTNGDTKPSLPPSPTPVEPKQPPENGVASVTKGAIKYRKPRAFNKTNWSAKAVQARLEFGEYITAPVAARLQMEGCLRSLEVVDQVIQFGGDIASGVRVNNEGVAAEDTRISTEDRVNAVTAVALAAKIRIESSIDIVKLAESANGRQPAGEGSKPKNKPPSLAFETVTADGATTRVVATSGETTE